MKYNPKLSPEENQFIERIALAALPELIRHESAIVLREAAADREHLGERIEPDGRFRNGGADAGDELAKEAYCIGWSMFNQRKAMLVEMDYSGDRLVTESSYEPKNNDD